MSSKTLKMVWLVLLGVIPALLTPKLSLAATPQGEAAELTIRPLKGAYHTIDIIPVVVELKNTGVQPLKLKALFAINEGLKVGFKLPSDHADRKYRGAITSFVMYHSDDDVPVTVVEPNTSLRHVCYVSPSLLGLNFKEPKTGSLKVKAKYSDGALLLESKPATVALKSSKNLPETVRTVFGAKNWHRFVIEDGRVEQNVSKVFKDYLASGNWCSQGDLLALTVGRSYHQGYGQVVLNSGFDPRGGGVVTGESVMPVRDLPAAVTCYNEVVSKAPDALKAKALLHLAECHFETKNDVDAKAALAQLAGIQCDSEVEARSAELLKKNP